MDVFRSAYVESAQTEFGEWVRRFWNEESDPSDPLYQLLKPQDLRGEVRAWGDEPHWTVTDALTTHEPKMFSQVVKDICQRHESPLIKPICLAIFGDTALVVVCDSPELAQIREEIIAGTRKLISKSPLVDEELQRAEWWIRKIHEKNKEVTREQLQCLHRAIQEYREAGAPPLPSSRHFRLGFLVRICKEIIRVEEDAKKNASAPALGEKLKRRNHHLDYFLSKGEPYWYESSGGFHVTIASGLKIADEHDRNQKLRQYEDSLWKKVQLRLKDFRPSYLAIMGESPNETMPPVSFYDWLTQTFVPEIRPPFKVVMKASFRTGNRA